MGTKIQQYDLEKKSADALIDIQSIYTKYTDPLTNKYKTVKQLFTAIDDFVEDQEEMNTKTQSLIDSMDMVVYASVGEEDRESFTYDPTSGNILKHEVYDKLDVLKFDIVFAYSDANAPDLLTGATKTYKTDKADVVVVSTYAYDASGNITGIQHAKTVTPFPAPTQPTP